MFLLGNNPIHYGRKSKIVPYKDNCNAQSNNKLIPNIAWNVF